MDVGYLKLSSEDEDCQNTVQQDLAAGEEIVVGAESLTLNAATEKKPRVSLANSEPSDTDTDESDQDHDPLKEKRSALLNFSEDETFHSASSDGDGAKADSPSSRGAETANLTSSSGSESIAPHGRASLKNPERTEGGSTSSQPRGARRLQGILKKSSGDDINTAEGASSGPATPKKASLAEDALLTEEPESIKDDSTVIAPTSTKSPSLSTSSNKSKSVHFDPSTVFSEENYQATRRDQRAALLQTVALTETTAVGDVDKAA